MNQLWLPEIKKIKISNYSLYNKEIEYDFIKGVNLIIGGNGVGKTTFINILKYALIGLYKKDVVVKNYDGELRISRGSYTNPNIYFRNRCQKLESDVNAEVVLCFSINQAEFTVKRSLYDVKMLAVRVRENGNVYYLQGKIKKQDEYEKLKEDEKKECLQYNYEQTIKKFSHLDEFEDFIFFINRILLFDETRDTILWDEEIQKRLSSTYFNNPQLERERKEAENKKIYYNSIARHKSEEIKAIRRVFDTMEDKKEDINSSTSNNIQQLYTLIEKDKEILEKYDEERKHTQNTLSEYYRKINDLSNLINEEEKEFSRIEEAALKIVWGALNPHYNVFKAQVQQNQICPFCNKPIDSHKFNIDAERCFFCNKKITTNDDETSAELAVKRRKLDEMYENRQSLEKEITFFEDSIKKSDNQYRKTKTRLFVNEKALREAETAPTQDGEKEDLGLQAMLHRMQQLTEEKDDAIQMSKAYERKANDFVEKIEKNLIDITDDVSQIFAEFAEAFLQLPCYLSYDRYGSRNVKMFIPSIDNILRKEEEELSESQRFFIDYSFRMSILSFFYNGPTFYVCETPDSSLDISYEINAAHTFMKYLEKPNILLITSNLNNSTFIDCLIESAPNIKVLNLLDYGKVSRIQRESEALQVASKRIEVKVNEKI